MPGWAATPVSVAHELECQFSLMLAPRFNNDFIAAVLGFEAKDYLWTPNSNGTLVAPFTMDLNGRFYVMVQMLDPVGSARVVSGAQRMPQWLGCSCRGSGALPSRLMGVFTNRMYDSRAIRFIVFTTWHTPDWLFCIFWMPQLPVLKAYLRPADTFRWEK